jgi:putative transposase
MTDAADTGPVGKRRRPEQRLVDEQLAEDLIAQEQGVDLLREGGLLQQMTKAVLERALAKELTDHLGYEEGDPAGRGSGNSRNGCTPKRLLTEAGHVDLEVPRDRNSTFDPQIVLKGSRRRDGIDALVISLYARA